MCGKSRDSTYENYYAILGHLERPHEMNVQQPGNDGRKFIYALFDCKSAHLMPR
jgi:hypothetical protein